MQRKQKSPGLFSLSVSFSNILLSLCSIALVLGVMEISLRLLGLGDPFHIEVKYEHFNEAIETSEHPFYPGYSGPFMNGYFFRLKPNATCTNVYPSNERGYFQPGNRISYQMNSSGFRDEVLFSNYLFQGLAAIGTCNQREVPLGFFFP